MRRPLLALVPLLVLGALGWSLARGAPGPETVRPDPVPTRLAGGVWIHAPAGTAEDANAPPGLPAGLRRLEFRHDGRLVTAAEDPFLEEMGIHSTWTGGPAAARLVVCRLSCGVDEQGWTCRLEGDRLLLQRQDDPDGHVWHLHRP